MLGPWRCLVVSISIALAGCGNPDPGYGGYDDPVQLCSERTDGGLRSSVIDPKGCATTWVVDSLVVPTTEADTQQLGLNLDGDELGRVDNALGAVLAALASAAGDALGLNEALDQDVRTASLLWLLRMDSTALTTATGVGVWFYRGENEVPAACAGETDRVCGRHLDGNGSASVAVTSPTDSWIRGDMVARRFTSGPGKVTLELPLGDGAPLAVELVGARTVMTVTDDEATLTGGVLAGAISMQDLHARVLPAVHAHLAAVVARDCTGTAPSCCATGSAGATITGLFDTTPTDCTVTVDELTNSPHISSLLAPDVDLLDRDGNYNPLSDSVKESFSIGVGFSAVRAAFDIPQ